MFQRQQGELAVPEGGRVEEIVAAEPLQQDRAFLIGDDRRQLVQVARQDHPYTAERAFGAAIELQAAVDGVQHVGAHHRDLVDHHRLHRAHHPRVGQAAHVLRLDQARGQLEEGMDCLPAGIHRGDTCGRDDHGLVAGLAEELAQKCGLAGAGPAGEEEVALRARAARHPFGGRRVDGLRGGGHLAGQAQGLTRRIWRALLVLPVLATTCQPSAS